MPPASKIRVFTHGEYFKNKTAAKQHAAYRAVIELYRGAPLF
jgi:hypothetical protein